MVVERGEMGESRKGAESQNGCGMCVCVCVFCGDTASVSDEIQSMIIW